MDVSDSVIGLVYPAIRTVRAIEMKHNANDVLWFSYWIVFSVFIVIENFTDFLLYWIPFYYAFKTAFFLWAFLPQTSGAKDLVKKSQSRIDAAVADAKKETASSIAADDKKDS